MTQCVSIVEWTQVFLTQSPRTDRSELLALPGWALKTLSFCTKPLVWLLLSGSLNFTSCMDGKEERLSEKGERRLRTIWAFGSSEEVDLKQLCETQAQGTGNAQGSKREMRTRTGLRAVHTDFSRGPPFSAFASRALATFSLLPHSFVVNH